MRLLLTLLLLLVPSISHAEKRIALLIGNKDYKSGVGALTNPLNDIRIVGDALKAVGFEVMKPVQNGRHDEMLTVIYEFASKLKAAGPNAVGFLYYSGHGIASAGENYLIPTDVDEPSTLQLNVHGVKHSQILSILRSEAPNAAHYLVLDACRNTLQGARGGKGFVPIDHQSGVLLAFAAEPGKTASDTGQGSGPYAAALAAELVRPGQNDLLMFHKVRVAVMAKTGGDQVPWTEDGIQRAERIMFGGEANTAPVTTPSPPPTQPQTSEAERVWPLVRDTTNPAILEDFINRYGDTIFATLARARIEELKQQQAAMAAPQKAPTPAPPRSSQPAAAIMPTSPPITPPTITSPKVPEVGQCDGVKAQVGNESRCLRQKDSFKDCPVCPEMIVIPPGEITMGSNDGESYEQPVHRVTIARPFAVGKFTVTFAEWDACVTDGGCKYSPDDHGWGREKRPVIYVSWDDATQEYLPWLTRRTGKTYRLLSEAEWEYAARAGSSRKYSWGDQIGRNRAHCIGCGSQRSPSPRGRVSDNDNNCVSPTLCSTAPVGSFEANAFGLYDMHGNVWQWVQDNWHPNYQGAPTDGTVWSGGDSSFRVFRGGSFIGTPLFLRSANRVGNQPNGRDYTFGFRVARTL
jgi:formylglycine-generating enzyme required for sulfatase activity